jgi:hypothetical protein
MSDIRASEQALAHAAHHPVWKIPATLVPRRTR